MLTEQQKEAIRLIKDENNYSLFHKMELEKINQIRQNGNFLILEDRREIFSGKDLTATKMIKDYPSRIIWSDSCPSCHGTGKTYDKDDEFVMCYLCDGVGYSTWDCDDFCITDSCGNLIEIL